MKSILLESKSTVTINGATVLDLGVQSVNTYQYEYESMLIISRIRVTDRSSMDFTALSNYFYGAPYYWDVILKANAIRDPFTIRTGDILVIPELNNWLKIMGPPLETSEIVDAPLDPIRKSFKS
jgi:hypothetical protein